jgi:hypothetical protein
MQTRSPGAEMAAESHDYYARQHPMPDQLYQQQKRHNWDDSQKIYPAGK